MVLFVDLIVLESGYLSRNQLTDEEEGLVVNAEPNRCVLECLNV